MIKSVNKRIPRAGKIRLGTPKQPNKPGQNVGYFRVQSQSLPQELIDSFLGSKQPSTIDIFFIRFFEDPLLSIEAIFDSSYQSWANGKRFCVGDGEKGTRLSPTGSIVEVQCTCELLQQKKCKQSALLKVGICNVPMIGYWELRSSSWNSIHQFSQVLRMYYELLGEEFFKTKFQLLKKQEQMGERLVWVTHINVHPEENEKLLQAVLSSQANSAKLDALTSAPQITFQEEPDPLPSDLF